MRAEAVLNRRLGTAYNDGTGGPGGWWILTEPEIHFERDTEVLVPDLAGWRRQRLPELPRDQRFEVVPDWICEVLSPSTRSKDREVKMPIYAGYSVAYAWLVDLEAQVLEAYALHNRTWSPPSRSASGDTLNAPPSTTSPSPSTHYGHERTDHDAPRGS